MSYNQQPVFTASPILYTQTFNPPLLNSAWDSGSITPEIVYYNSGEPYVMIDRVTVTSTGDEGHFNISAKLVYLLVQDYGTNYWGVYKVAALPATTISHTVPNPEIVWTFDGGLPLGPTYNLGGGGYKLGIMASANYSTNSSYGDYLSVTVEGSTYSYTY